MITKVKRNIVTVKDILNGKSNFTVDVCGMVKTVPSKEMITAKINE